MYTAGDWKGRYIEKGNYVEFNMYALMDGDDATDFKAYFDEVMAHTTTANRSCTRTPTPNATTATITVSDFNARSLTVHQAVQLDVDTIEQALLGADSDITAANAAAAAHAAAETFLTYATVAEV